ncbi:hypothetical protein ACI79J_08900 [Geodermatophilus sp. SYSU D01062]
MIQVHYTSGFWSFASIVTGESLPTGHVLWFTARILLDVAGGFFLLYLLLLGGLAVVALVAPGPRVPQVAGTLPPGRGRHRRGGAR